MLRPTHCAATCHRAANSGCSRPGAGALGVNLYLSPQFRAFAAWNIAGGIAFIPLAMWLSRRYGERLSRSSIVRHIADSIAGRDIAAAREYLEKLRRFGGDAD